MNSTVWKRTSQYFESILVFFFRCTTFQINFCSSVVFAKEFIKWPCGHVTIRWLFYLSFLFPLLSLTGYSPFQGETHQETFLNVSTCDFDFDDEVFEVVSQEAKEFIEKLLVKQPTWVYTYPYAVLFCNDGTNCQLLINFANNLVVFCKIDLLLFNEFVFCLSVWGTYKIMFL